MDGMVCAVQGGRVAGAQGKVRARHPYAAELSGPDLLGTKRPAILLLCCCAMGQWATWRQKPEQSGDVLGCLVALRELTVEAVLVIDSPRSAWADPLALEIGVVVGCPHWHLDERCFGNLLE